MLPSNNTRDFSDALKRRCLHLYVPFPDRQQGEAIILMHLGDIDRELACQVSLFLSRVRKLALRKQPGISEAIDWARSLMALNVSRLEPGAVGPTLNALLKYEEDVAAVEAKIEDLSPPPGQSPEIQWHQGGETGPGPAAGPPDNDILSRFNF